MSFHRMLYHFKMWLHVISQHITSFHVTAYKVMSCHTIMSSHCDQWWVTYHVTSHHITSCHIASCCVTLLHVTASNVTYVTVTSLHVTVCPTCHIMQSHYHIRPFKIDCMFCVRIFQKSYARVRKENTQHEKLHRISIFEKWWSFHGKLLCVFFVKTKKILPVRWRKTYNQF